MSGWINQISSPHIFFCFKANPVILEYLFFQLKMRINISSSSKYLPEFWLNGIILISKYGGCRWSQPAESVVVAVCKYTQTTEILWRKRGCVAALQVKERAPDPLLDSFYCFCGHITWRMVLIYYAQVHHRWLPFKEDKGQDTANYFKEKDVTAQGGSCSPSILGWFTQTLGRWRYSVNICCLNSGWGSFSKRKSHSSLGTMQAWFPTGELIHGRGSCPPTSLPTGFSEWGLSHISHAWNSSPH